MRLTFLGGAGTVTGSKYLVETGSKRILFDCGLFQGLKELRSRNWQRLPVNARAIDAVVMTHAHLDHSGYLPLLVRQGFVGPVYCTASTKDLCEILLPDSGFLQERDAEFANRHGYSRHKPALPLYTKEDAHAALSHLKPVAFHETFDVGGVRVVYSRAGHFLGAASVTLEAEDKRIVLSGDIGRYGDPILPDPEPIQEADYLLVESTYGDRLHDKMDPGTALGEVVNRTVSRGGTVVIPAFAVGRAQHLMFYLERLKRAGALQHVPVFLDSPMAVDASDIFCRNLADHRLPEGECQRACAVAIYVHSTEESKALTQNPMPKVIISASGMATGGRVLHHLKRYAPDPRCTILFAGYQAAGTRGQAMMAGAKTITIHGAEIAVNAEVQNLSMLSAHADQDELMRWLRHFKSSPHRTFMIHGESHASTALATRITGEFGWSCHIPKHFEPLELS
jgi:metallo-beta-lactamase family protein